MITPAIPFFSRFFLLGCVAIQLIWSLPLPAQSPNVDSLRVEAFFNQLGAHCYTNLDSSLHYLDIVLKETGALGWHKEKAYAYLWGILCTGYHDQVDLKYELLQEASRFLSEKEQDIPPAVLAATDLDLQMHWGDYYLETGGYNGALDIYEALSGKLESQTSWTDEEFQRLVICYQYLASIHQRRGSFKQAIDYYFRALNFERQYYQRQGRQNAGESQAYSRIANAYWLMGERELALYFYRPAFQNELAYYQKDPAANSRLRKRLISMGLELGRYYGELGKGDSALYFLDRVRPMIQPAEPLFQELRMENAQVLSRMGQNSRALDTLQLAIDHLKWSKAPGYLLTLGKIYNTWGDIFRSQGAFSRALQAYQNALACLAENFVSTDLHNNPTVTSWIAPRDLLYALTQKTRLLVDHPPDPSSQWLTTAWNTARAGMDLVDSIKNGYSSDYDKQFLLEDSYDLYELALHISHDLGGEYGEAALEIMERSKAVALFAAVRDLHARTYAGVPEDQLEKMRQIRYQLEKLDAQLEQTTGERSQIDLREQRLQLKSRYDAVIRSFEQDYPDYYRLKYRQGPVKVSEVLRDPALKGSLVIEYFLGDDHLYACAIAGTSKKPELYQLNWTSELSQWAIDLKDDIYGQRDEAFRRKAQALYQALLAPVLADSRPQRLLIIPDGILGYLPFDLLLTEAVPAQQADNFRLYPFLMKKMAVSQNFSLAMLGEMQPDRSSNTKRLLAFAPNFPTGNYVAQRDSRNALGELLFNKAEAEAVLYWFDGTLVADGQATKKEFLEQAPGFGMYHIASHAIIDDEAPNNSYIAFTSATDSSAELSRLYSYEILAHAFPADLVVLSACETGVGKVLRGEGIMSLARAFSYAGARSLITSLWNVNDQSGQQLMAEFYRQLRSGVRKDEALRQAKLAYLESALDNARTHPRYWAAFIPTGNMEPLTPGWSWKWGIPLLVVMVLFSFFAFRKKP